MGKSFIIKVDLYNHDILFSFGQDKAQLKKVLSRYFKGNKLKELIKDLNISESQGGKCALLETGQIIVRMPTKPSITDEDFPMKMANLQHEIFHAVSFLMQHIGTRLSQSTEEPYAYAIGYVTQKVYERLGF